MRILHTADWHLNDRLGRIDRTDDLRRAVERVADYCRTEDVDLLLVAGDLFSELARPDGLRDSISHLQETFGPFLRGGGTILAITGNHDNENFCQTLRHAMSLASPLSDRPGDLAPAGRLYLATGPTLLRLPDRRTDGQVQFVLMPYPTPGRYFHDDESRKYASLEEKNRALLTAYVNTLKSIQTGPTFDSTLPSVLSAHVAVTGTFLSGGGLFRLSEQEDVVVSEADLPTGFAYVALGHIHRAQPIAGMEHVRYSGSIERMDLGEKNDAKGVVIVDIVASGLAGEARTLPVEATPVYEVKLTAPTSELPGYRERYPDARDDLVKIEFTYQAGVDNLQQVLEELDDLFPRWYDRKWREANALDGEIGGAGVGRAKGFEETIRDYLRQELVNHSAELMDAVLGQAEDLMAEVEP